MARPKGLHDELKVHNRFLGSIPITTQSCCRFQVTPLLTILNRRVWQSEIQRFLKSQSICLRCFDMTMENTSDVHGLLVCNILKHRRASAICAEIKRNVLREKAKAKLEYITSPYKKCTLCKLHQRLLDDDLVLQLLLLGFCLTEDGFMRKTLSWLTCDSDALLVLS
ncbi:hypothetical protein J6590_038811 [Homalodisca vitripennis]|nr:hypothetical protein J6590_038811 [Homalodisca vitripennis]